MLTGILKRFFLPGFVLVLSRVVPCAQEVSFSAVVSSNVVEVGQRFSLSFTLNSQGKDFAPPALGEFLVLSGPNQSTSSSVQIINGKMTQTVSLSFTYLLQAVREGTFTIEPARVKVGREEYSTEPVEITVVAGTTQRQAKPGQEPASSTLPDLPADDLFVKLIPSSTEVYPGQHIAITVKIFSRVDLSAIDEIKFPAFTGFFQQEIEIEPLRGLTREVVNGQVYGTGVLRQVLLYPQKSGEMVIEPVEIRCQVRQRMRTQTPRGFFDEFFDSFQSVPQQISSKPVTIQVKPYPVPAPAGFSGLTGNYSLKASIDRSEVTENEAVNISYKVTGNGNIKLLEAPQVSFPPDFEKYDPRVSSDIKNEASGSKGSKSFEYLVIPRSAGNFRVPPVEISYFNPSLGRFEYLRSPEFSITVQKSDQVETGAIVSGFGKEALKYLGKDIRFIKTAGIRMVPVGRTFAGSPVHYSAYAIFTTVFLSFWIFMRRRQKARANIELMRNRRAVKVARQRLRSARQAMKENNPEGFYEETLQALWGYFSDKLTIPVSWLSRETVLENLRKHNISANLIEEISGLIDSCEYARYAPRNENTELAQSYEKTLQVVSKLEQNLR